MKLIQLGISFANDKNEIAQTVYQFNFQFTIANDLNNERSIDLLKTHKLNFEKHHTEGISPIFFSYLL